MPLVRTLTDPLLAKPKRWWNRCPGCSYPLDPRDQTLKVAFVGDTSRRKNL